jgi:hypothetical protein
MLRARRLASRIIAKNNGVGLTQPTIKPIYFKTPKQIALLYNFYYITTVKSSY